MLRKSFNLESSLYKKRFIEQAIQDFGVDFIISYKARMLEITGDTISEIEEIFHEFMNYVVGLHNET